MGKLNQSCKVRVSGSCRLWGLPAGNPQRPREDCVYGWGAGAGHPLGEVMLLDPLPAGVGSPSRGGVVDLSSLGLPLPLGL